MTFQTYSKTLLFIKIKILYTSYFFIISILYISCAIYFRALMAFSGVFLVQFDARKEFHRVNWVIPVNKILQDIPKIK